MIYQKIALFHIHFMIQCITACYKICLRDITLNPKFQNLHIKSFNSDFSVSNALNITIFLGDALCSPLEGSMSQNFDLGPGYFFMLCRKFVKYFFTIFCVSCHKNKPRTYIKIFRHYSFNKNVLNIPRKF